MTEDTLALPIELLGSIERYAVYRCYSNSGQLLYVGETGDLGTRLADHAKKLWFVQVRGITLEWYADELEALKAERRAIHVEHPKYNKQHNGNARALPATPRPPKRQRTATQTAEQRAQAVWASDPNISGAELARRIGVSESHGRRLRAQLAGQGPERSDERS
jgi:predicted GIY-YIG superfamily endonuclease